MIAGKYCIIYIGIYWFGGGTISRRWDAVTLVGSNLFDQCYLILISVPLQMVVVLFFYYFFCLCHDGDISVL